LVLESQSASPLSKELRRITRNCQEQQQALKMQKAKLRLQRLSVLRPLKNPCAIKRLTMADSKAESDLSYSAYAAALNHPTGLP
jgi:hypothetical protein